MNTISTILNAWTKFVQESGNETQWLEKFFEVLYPVLYAILAITGAAGAVYAIFLGISMAKADTTEKREEAKKRMINTIVAVVVAIALILFFNEILPLILKAFVTDSMSTEGGEEGEQMIRGALTLLR
ncbi:MAG: hypothetical protein IJ008_05345 [Clostridia bacterium]|nr:hypothetical protein [Clostridia bacterium]